MQPDADIWLRIKNNDEAAYEEMYAYYYKRFYIYGRKITPLLNTVEDVIQEIMILIWQSRSTLSDIKSPSAYYYTSFRNLLISKLKSDGQLFSEEYLQEELSDSAEENLIVREELFERDSKIKKATGFLTARQNEAIFLRFYEGLSYEEVAEVMGITVKATYKIMARALSELRDKYVHLLLLLFQVTCLLQ